MKTHAAPGGLVGRGSKRRGLLLFAVLLVIAQILLFAVLRQRSRDDSDSVSPSVAPTTAATQPAPTSPAPTTPAEPTAQPPTPPAPQSAVPVTPTPEPENRPIETKTASNADSATEEKEEAGHR